MHVTKGVLKSKVKHKALLFCLLSQAEKKAKKEQEKQADLDYDAQREAAFCKDQKFRR